MLCLHPVTLTASSPAYFRGFILVALREGAEGDRDEDYTGNFQVRYRRFTVPEQSSERRMATKDGSPQERDVCEEKGNIVLGVGDTRVWAGSLLPSPTSEWDYSHLTSSNGLHTARGKNTHSWFSL